MTTIQRIKISVLVIIAIFILASCESKREPLTEDVIKQNVENLIISQLDESASYVFKDFVITSRETSIEDKRDRITCSVYYTNDFVEGYIDSITLRYEIGDDGWELVRFDYPEPTVLPLVSTITQKDAEDVLMEAGYDDVEFLNHELNLDACEDSYFFKYIEITGYLTTVYEIKVNYVFNGNWEFAEISSDVVDKFLTDIDGAWVFNEENGRQIMVFIEAIDINEGTTQLGFSFKMIPQIVQSDTSSGISSYEVISQNGTDLKYVINLQRSHIITICPTPQDNWSGAGEGSGVLFTDNKGNSVWLSKSEAKKDEIRDNVSTKTVSLKKLTAFQGYLFTETPWGGATYFDDNMGNYYLNRTIVNDAVRNDSQSVTYSLQSNYSTLKFDIGLRNINRDTDCSSWIEIYGDGSKLLETTHFSSGSIPESYSVDISNVDKLELRFTHTTNGNKWASDYAYLVITDFLLFD